jgi:hypothetical protein
MSTYFDARVTSDFNGAPIALNLTISTQSAAERNPCSKARISPVVLTQIQTGVTSTPIVEPYLMLGDTHCVSKAAREVCSVDVREKAHDDEPAIEERPSFARHFRQMPRIKCICSCYHRQCLSMQDNIPMSIQPLTARRYCRARRPSAWPA